MFKKKEHRRQTLMSPEKSNRRMAGLQKRNRFSAILFIFGLKLAAFFSAATAVWRGKP